MMSTSLAFEQLPDIPQMVHFKKIATQLWARDDVIAIWLGGSIGTGKADRYSDIDLRLAIRADALEKWQKPDLNDILGRPNVNHWSRPVEEDASLHHVLLDNAEMYDLWVQDARTGAASRAKARPGLSR